MAQTNKLDKFMSKWDELSKDTKISLFNNYTIEYGDSDEVFENFDEEGISLLTGDDVMEAVRATCYGEVNFNDEYIRKDAYGNFQSYSEYDAAEYADDYSELIFEHEDIWEDYININ